MIEPTEADIGRRVIYSHPALNSKGRGVITGLAEHGWVWVKFDSDSYPDGAPLRTGPECLSWAPERKALSPDDIEIPSFLRRLADG